MNELIIRHAEPADYPSIIAVIDAWWGGRRMADMLPKLFFIHFRPTSFIAERDGKLIGFITGFVSQSYSGEAYIHFAGVRPDFRKKGIGRLLYEKFFAAVEKLGCRKVRCVTSPANKDSISFHEHLGFSPDDSEYFVDGIPVAKGYDGRGGDRVLFSKLLNG